MELEQNPYNRVQYHPSNANFYVTMYTSFSEDVPKFLELGQVHQNAKHRHCRRLSANAITTVTHRCKVPLRLVHFLLICTVTDALRKIMKQVSVITKAQTRTKQLMSFQINLNLSLPTMQTVTTKIDLDLVAVLLFQYLQASVRLITTMPM